MQILVAVLLQKYNRAPTPQELAQHLEQPLSRVLLALRKGQSPLNLDAQPADNERDSMVDLLASSIDEDGGENALSSEMHRCESLCFICPQRTGPIPNRLEWL